MSTCHRRRLHFNFIPGSLYTDTNTQFNDFVRWHSFPVSDISIDSNKMTQHLKSYVSTTKIAE